MCTSTYFQNGLLSGWHECLWLHLTPITCIFLRNFYNNSQNAWNGLLRYLNLTAGLQRDQLRSSRNMKCGLLNVIDANTHD